MKTDPRKACANERERFFWAFVHGLIAHGFMALSLWSKWSLEFHDWTSHKAWPRIKVSDYVVVHSNEVKEIYPMPPLLVKGLAIKVGDWSFKLIDIEVQQIKPGVWKANHPKVAHSFVTTASDEFDMAMKALSWFKELSTEFGGRFTLE